MPQINFGRIRVLILRSLLAYKQTQPSGPHRLLALQLCMAHPQHLLAIGFELVHAQAADALQITQAVWRGFGDRGQRGVVEDHIRGQVVFFGHIGTPSFEVDVAHHRVWPEMD